MKDSQPFIHLVQPLQKSENTVLLTDGRLISKLISSHEPVGLG